MLPITRVWHDDVPDSLVAPDPRSTPLAKTACEESAHQPAGAHPSVSIVLVARSGPLELTRALEALANQTYPSHLMEVIVVSPTNEARTSRLVAALARQRPGLRLRFVSCPPERGMAAARNRGWRRATGRVVGFTTDAVVPGPRWVEGAMSAFDPIVDVVGGQIVVPLSARPSVPERHAAERLQAPWTAHNVFYRRSLLLELDGFDECFSRQGHDDTDLILSAITAGARFCAAEGAVVVHGHPAASWRDELRRQVLHADEARLYRKHAHLYRQYVRPIPPASDYLSLAALGGMLVGIVLRRHNLARASTGLWTGLILLRVGRVAREAPTSTPDLLALLLMAGVQAPITMALRLYGAIKHHVWFL